VGKLPGTKTTAKPLFHMANQTLPATAFKSPVIALSGVVDYEMYTKFRTQFDSASDQNIVVTAPRDESHHAEPPENKSTVAPGWH
jgi:hypothetical protein